MRFDGTVDRITYRNDENGFTVAQVTLLNGTKLAAVGLMPFLSQGERAVFEGDIVEHREYGQQIRVTGYDAVRPESEEELVKYLSSGLIRGVGPATARLIVEAFGPETLTVLTEEPERLTEVPSIGKKRAAMIAESFMENNSMRVSMMFLQRYGLTPGLAARVYRTFRENTEQVVRTNPYRLADEVDGVGFQTADRIALSMGFRPDSPFRLKSGLRFVLTEAANASGHMYLPYEKLVGQAAHVLGADEDEVDNALRAQIIEGSLTAETVEGETAVYLPWYYEAEAETAFRLQRLMRSFEPDVADEGFIEELLERSERMQGVSLHAAQREAAMTALKEGVLILTGGPGTGKTTCINAIIRILREFGEVELCAPTGRAARRMSETTGQTARTIHRLLEFNGEGARFMRDENNPIDAETVIVDETSMVDIFLMRALLRALRPGTRLILVGDSDQLPSVGAGNVLRDLLESGAVPSVRLTEIFRQAATSMIVSNAHRINRGELPVIRNKDTDFFFERKETIQACVDAVVQLVKRRLPNFLGVDALRGIQVMTPMKRTDVGVYALNLALQAAINPPAEDKEEWKLGSTVFRTGDKVMQVKNDYDLEWVRGRELGAGVFNGDIGFIRHIDRQEGLVTVEFDDGREADYDVESLEDLELAYCVTVHKSQGSEFEAVVLPLFSGPPMLMTRNLLYTAVTRAKRLVVVVGREGCVRQMVMNDHIDRRYSALHHRLSGRA